MANEFRIKNGLIVSSGTVTLSTFTLPATLGNNGDVLRIPSGGGTTLEWASFATVGSAGVTAVNNFAENRLTTVGSTTSELDGEANLTFDGSAFQVTGTLTVGVDDTGHDVKFFGATSGSYMLWDESTDDLILGGAARLGIGITAPDELLHVSGAAAGDSVSLKVTNTDDTDNASIASLHLESQRGTDSHFYLEHDAFGATKFYTGQGAKNHALTMNADGSTTVEAALTGDSTASFTGSLTMNYAGSDVYADIIGPSNRNLRFVLRDNGDTDSFLFRNAAGTDLMALLRTGSLGIGTTSPTGTLTVTGSGHDLIHLNRTVDNEGYGAGIIGRLGNDSSTTAAHEYAGIFFQIEDHTDGAEKGSIAFNTSTGGTAADQSSTHAMQITSAGNVGIGTTSPQSLLDVRGAAGSPGTLTLSTAETTVVDGDKLGKIDFQAPLDSAGTDAILVGASIWAEADATFAADNNRTELVFATGGSATAAEQVRITHDGKLGIGTATPSRALDVNGDLVVRGNDILDSGVAAAITFDGSQNTTIAGDLTVSGNDIKDSGGTVVTFDGSQNTTLAGHLTLGEAKAIYFDSTDTFITTNSDNPEDLLIGADEDIFISPDDDLHIQVGTTTYATFDGTNQRLGIGVSAPDSPLHINVDDSDEIEFIAELRNTPNPQASGLENFGAGIKLALSSGSGNELKKWVGLAAIKSPDLNYSRRVDAAFYTQTDASGGTDPTEKMRITGVGNVGIGNTTPQSLLDVRGAAGSPGTLTLSTAETTVVDGDKLGRIDFNAPVEGSGTDAILIGASIWAEADDTFAADNNATELVFATGASEAAAEKMRLTSDGKLGIGDSTPAEALQVAGSIRVNDNGAIKADGSGYLQLGNTSGGLIRLLGDGSTSRIRGEANSLQIETNRDSDDIKFAVNKGGTDSDDTVVEAMRIVGDTAFVGIGVGAPDKLLHVIVGSNDDTVALFSTAGGGSGSTQGSVHIGLSHFNTDANPSVRIGAEENGTGSYQAALTFGTRSATSDADPAERMRLTHEGKLGINNTTPQSLLDVRGDAGSPGILTLSTAETTVVDGDKLGRIDFQAPVEGSGTDAILVGASIWAEADDTFAADNNSTELVFATGASEAPVERMRITHEGHVEIAGNLTVTGTTITAEVETVSTSNGVLFEGSSDDANETLLVGGNPGGDITLTLPTTAGTLALESTSTYTAGTGLDLSSYEFSVDVSDFMTSGANDRVLTATGTDAFQGEANLTFNGSKLHVDRSSVVAASLTFEADAAAVISSENSQLAFGLHNASPWPFYMQARTHTDGARQLMINPLGGNVGIGALDADDYKLHVDGDIGLTGDMYLASAKAIYFDSTDTFIKTNSDDPEDLVIGADQDVFIRPDHDVIFEIGTTEYVRFEGDNQRVGIGVSAPSSKLHVQHTDNTTFAATNQIDDYQIFVKNNTVTIDAIAGIAFDVSTETDADTVGASIAAIRDTSASSTAANHDTNLVFSTNDAGDDGNTERMRITHDGYVLVGKTAGEASIDRKLEVDGTIAAADTGASGGIGFHMANSEGEFIIYTDGGHLVVKDYAGSDTYPFKIEGTAETDTLIVNTGGDVTIKDALTLGSEIIHSGDTNNKIGFGTDTQTFTTGGSTRLSLADTVASFPNSSLGIGTTTAPHGGVGKAVFAIDGTNANTAGPHIQYTTASDDHPLFQQLNWTHDNIAMSFDAYYDGSWKSSDAGSNFQIYKLGDFLNFRYDSGIAQGSAVSWNNGLTISSAGAVNVPGAFSATTKSFVIEHPTKEGMTLEHGSLEGPEHGVYVRGKLERDNVIELPDYWTGLVDDDTVSVQLTPNKSFQQLYVEKIEDNKVYVKNMTNLPINCFFFIQAERKDIDKMVVEY